MITKSKLKEIIKEELEIFKEKLNEGGKFRLSPDADLMWHGSDIIIISGRHRVVLDKKELGNIIAAAKRHRLTR